MSLRERNVIRIVIAVITGVATDLLVDVIAMIVAVTEEIGVIMSRADPDLIRNKRH